MLAPFVGNSCSRTAILLAVLTSWTFGVLCEEPVAAVRCDSAWSSVRTALENVTSVSLHCRLDQRCMGISCDGPAVSAGIHVKPCDDPISVVVRANVPQLGVVDWTRTFTRETPSKIYPIPGARVKMGDVGAIEGMVQVNVTQDGRRLRLGVALKGKVEGKNLWPVSVPLVVDREIAVPPCDEAGYTRPDTYVVPGVEHRAGDLGVKLLPSAAPPPKATEKRCNVSQFDNGCDVDEICTEPARGASEGACRCLNGRDSAGRCYPRPTVPSVSDSSPRDVDSATAAPTGQRSPSTAVQVAVPLAVLVVCSVLLYLGVKLRAFHRLRARILRVSGHEELMVGEEEDEDPRRPAIA